MLKYPIAGLTLVALLFTSCMAQSPNSKPKFTAIDLPAMEGAYRLERGVEEGSRTFYLTYFLKIEYPPKKVTDFYIDYFKKNGWVETDRHTSNGWIDYPNQRGEERWWTTTYFTIWDQPEFGVSVQMGLSYTHETEEVDDELHVFFRTINTGFDKATWKFLGKLQKDPKGRDFFQLLSKYQKDPKSEPDFERAIRENPDNEYLKEYKAIYDKYLK